MPNIDVNYTRKNVDGWNTHQRRHVRGSRVIADEHVHSCESEWYVGDVKLADGVDALIRRQCRREQRGVRFVSLAADQDKSTSGLLI